MSFSSNGLSFKFMSGRNPNRISNATSIRESKYNIVTEDGSNSQSCCFNKCQKKTYFNGYLTCGVFRNTYDKTICTLFVLFVISILLGVFIPIIVNSIADNLINQQVIIDSPDAINYDAWQNNIVSPGNDLKIGYNVYFFDVQNPTEILNGAVPVVTEIGPYAFDEYYYKFDIKFFDDGDTVQCSQQKYYIFNQEKTNPGLSLDDDITQPYAIAIGFQYLLNQIPYNASILLENFILKKIDDSYIEIEAQLSALEKILKVMPAKKALYNEVLAIDSQITRLYHSLESFIEESNPSQLFFKAIFCYNDPVRGLSPFWSVKPVPGFFGYLNDPILVAVANILKVLEEDTGVVVPWTSAVPGVSANYTSIEDTRRRISPDTFKTGKKDLKEIDKYVKYNNMTTLWVCVAPMDSQNTSLYIEGEMFPACELYDGDWTPEIAAAKGYIQPFATPYANRIAGTDATLFGRPLTTEKLQVFISDIYRSAYLIKTKDIDWYGVNVFRYSLQIKDLLNATLNPENAQYYNFAPSGMLNITKATGVPLWASFPHFVDGSPELVAQIRGLQPIHSVHDSYLDIEPQTGLLVGAYKRLQVSYYLEPQKYPTLPQSIPSTLNEICHNLTLLIPLLEENGISVNVSVPTCSNLTTINPVLACLATNSDWNYHLESGYYFPYTWVQEYFELSEDDANSLNDSLLFVENFGSIFSFWCFVVGFFLISMILASIFTRSYVLQEFNIALEREYRMAGGDDDSSEASSPVPKSDFDSFRNSTLTDPLNP